MENISSQFTNSTAQYKDLAHDSRFLQIKENEEKVPQSCELLKNYSENDIDSKIGIKQNDDIDNYRKLVHEYYSKVEDLQNECTILHRNLQEIKEAYEESKVSKEQALKEKENMTVKFARGEKNMLIEKQLKEKAEKKCDELSKEIESLHRKLQIKTQETSKISFMYDNKIQELKGIQSDNNWTTNENTILKNELKLCQIALRNQAELYKKAQNNIKNLNETIQTITETKEEQEKCIEDLQEKLKGVELENEEKDLKLQNLEKSFNDMRFEDKSLQTEISRYGENLEPAISSYASINEIHSEKTNVSYNISNEMLEQLEIRNEDLENEIHLCRAKESETLEFNQQLSEKNVELQSTILDFQNDIQELTDERNVLKEKYEKINKEFKTLAKQYTEEKDVNHMEKLKILSELDCVKKNLLEQNRQNIKLKQQLLDLEEEFFITRKKYDSTLKELKKEIKLSKQTESIGIIESSSYLSTVSKCTEMYSTPETETKLDGDFLVQRIVNLQKISVLKSERIDYLEDQIEGLILKLRKKDTLLQFYFLQEETETVTSNELSNAKVNLCKLGGIMASIYDARIADDNLTVQLLLEINCKLQAVLEDVLLKNIILKSSIEILGKEIDKLNKQLKN